ncbi:transporter substrate-binding domain-containing protein [Oceaniovalibus sp. ACAM 378]|uniref:transporter substrate-binding domain-containing protein n=1 Tax=Oceaniovalibus sp. ACAM 378 TaxID=2599923 RepID=UPI0011D5B337|nr:transporter substrate-binding domain-containing protein [Oceaniovalibus sp. ACAM 378]TYB90509.1 transporter substrate-binding domain-containing protein [Oceaniovalibus sp. ACAM 378]
MKIKLLNILKVTLAAAALSSAATLPAAAAELADIQAANTIKVGVLIDFPPYGILNENNEPDGYDATVAKTLADDLGVELNLIPVTGPNRIPFLLSGQVDILVSSLAISPARAEKVDFSNPYAAIRIGVMGQADLDITSAADLAGVSVAVARASGQDTTITEIAPETTEIRRFDDDVSAVQALLSGQVQTIGASNTVMAQIRQIAPGRFDEKFTLNQFRLAIAVSPDAPELLAYVNEFLAGVTASGALNEAHMQWLDEPLPSFNE